jgi:hypothetical protein
MVLSVRLVLISYVIRLAPAALADGELAGEVEHVASGVRGQFRGAEQLQQWCVRHGLAIPEARKPASDVRHLH